MATATADRATLRPRVTKRLLDEIVQRIVERFQPQKIILFGSYAYGQPHQDSDIDLFVIMDSDLRPALRCAAVSSACHPGVAPMDIIVRTPAEVEQRLAMGDFFVAEILEKGRVLYERVG
jgi:hypothetical protein